MKTAILIAVVFCTAWISCAPAQEKTKVAEKRSLVQPEIITFAMKQEK